MAMPVSRAGRAFIEKGQIMKTMSKHKAEGFTLIEIIIVVVVIGVLMAVFLPSIRDAVSPSKSVAVMRATDQISTTFNLLAKTCATSTAVASTPLPAAGRTISDVLFGGSANVASAYSSCYTAAQVKAMAEVGQPSSTAGVYTVQGFPFSMAGGGTTPLQLSFANVPDEVTLAIANRFTPSLTALAASDSTSPVVRYGTATGGLRTVTIIKQ